jgi:oligoribonuclease
MTADTERLLLWIDCETTGFREEAGSLLEVGLILTGWDLEEVASWSRLVAFWGPVDDEIARMHGPGGSGLLTPDPDGKKWYTGDPSTFTSSPSVVAASAAEWVAAQCHGLAPIWGGRNTHFDRRWLREHMSALDDVVLHRSFDETTARLVLEAWGGVRLPKDPAGGTRHRALDDLRQSLAIARRLRSFILRARAAGIEP